MKKIILISAMIVSLSATVPVFAAGDASSIRFVINNSTNTTMYGWNYEYKTFLFNDFSVSHNKNVTTFSPNLSGPFPGSFYTDGNVGIFVQNEKTKDEICAVSTNAELTSDGQHPVSFYVYPSYTPEVVAESNEYGCVAYNVGNNEIDVDIVKVH